MSRLDNAVIWYADYGIIPESPYRFTFWQYSNTGWVEGIPEGMTDLNVWFVEREEK
jgi:GH25 family lysozyme M1 (1,4-beta-N-acetylmuramidase)